MQYTDLLEKRRHNLASEELSAQDIGEKIRHDYQTEDLERSSQALSKAIQESKNRIDIYKIESDRQIANVKNALEQYKLDIERWAKENGLRIDAAKANAALKKTDFEIDKLVADTAKTVADTDLTKAKEREVVTKLNGSLQGLAGSFVSLMLGDDLADPNSGLVTQLAENYKLTSAIGWKPTGINVYEALRDIARGKNPAEEWMRREKEFKNERRSQAEAQYTSAGRTHSTVNARKFKQ
jgi:hypothetical protein